MTYRRHPAEVTSDRLADHYERWFDRMDGQARDAITLVRDVLERIAGNEPMDGPR